MRGRGAPAPGTAAGASLAVWSPPPAAGTPAVTPPRATARTSAATTDRAPFRRRHPPPWPRSTGGGYRRVTRAQAGPLRADTSTMDGASVLRELRRNAVLLALL